MGSPTRHSTWELAAEQHGVVARRQLLELGMSAKAIRHRIATGRLHPVRRGVYAVGRPALGRHGQWMAAVLASGPEALLSHRSAAALLGIGKETRWIDVSVRTCSHRRLVGVRLHRRTELRVADVTSHEGIPLSAPTRTLVDLAGELDRRGMERAINEADRLDLVDPDALRAALDGYSGERGVARLRTALDRRTFRLTDSELERRFLRLVADAGLEAPQTRRRLNGFRVDFFWPGLGLVVETDGLRYHRTPAQQARDHERDQAQAAAGLTPLRFTHAQVHHEPRHVIATVRAVAKRLGRPAAGAAGPGS